MSNYHLRDKRLSLKARDLLSQILSLPEKWDMTIAGLSKIDRECSDTIASIIKELENTGYITRYRERRDNGTYNAPVTLDNYYAAEVNHDLYGTD